MPFMIVSDDDYEKELARLDDSEVISIEPSLSIEQIERGRGNTPAVPEGLREVIAEESLQGTPSAVIQKAFGISPASISAYKNGATSTASYHKPSDKLNQVRTRVSSRAANRLNEALKALGNKNLEDEKAKDIASIAKDMAVVFDKISPVKQQERADEKAMHIHLYAPKMKSVEDYEVIDMVQKSE